MARWTLPLNAIFLYSAPTYVGAQTSRLALSGVRNPCNSSSENASPATGRRAEEWFGREQSTAGQFHRLTTGFQVSLGRPWTSGPAGRAHAVPMRLHSAPVSRTRRRNMSEPTSQNRSRVRPRSRTLRRTNASSARPTPAFRSATSGRSAGQHVHHAGVTGRGRDQPVLLADRDPLADPPARMDLRTRGNIEDRVDAPVLRHAATIQPDATGNRREFLSPATERGKVSTPCAAQLPGPATSGPSPRAQPGGATAQRR